MQWFKIILASLLITLASGCSSWVYRMNIPQGNFLEQKDIDKLRIEMTREQVIYVLGQPIATDAFDDSSWHYVYLFNYNRNTEQKKSVVIHFKDDLLSSVSGDFETPEEFNTPLEK
ncbi:outer membrane protein assembly factor BamE [Pseudoalteromonas denitrificans]|jgi:outer membrane protein assembly factor BamE|uniref:Outer membrane protein assembly factor BamE n=1 Tax=Pseudoalteromonas denitrificans DSM 6059 TaxID=1123010 RepID=A0A1I1F177_9GAMM|nr:outer membrane protein assembly factor BamE [Pseudoalteromonas denitrificans]SFB90940.1 Beta-barrel assembly machine subunit BamE [Pseudoalteromonas denitrificans DSM 6059]